MQGILLAAASRVIPKTSWSVFLVTPQTPGAREPLLAGRSVLDLLGLAQGIQRFVDGQEDCRF